MDAYQLLLEQRKRAPWRAWPAGQRAVLPHMARDRAAGQLPVWYPAILYIEPTNACNANCVFCPRHAMTRKRGYMDMALYERIIGQAAELGPSEIRLFHYGEPLLHPHLPAMVRLAAENGLKARFQSNGLLVNEKTILELLEAGMNYIGISVNGLTPADYRAVRPGHRHEQLVENLTRLRRLIDLSGKPCHIHVNAHAPRAEIRERNADVQAFARTWQPIADTLSVSGLSLYDGVATLSRGQVTPAALAELPRTPDQNVCCTEPFDRLIIKWDGRVSPCCADYDARLTVGDLARQTLEEIWNGEVLEALREKIRARAYSGIAVCRTCPKFYSEPYSIVLKKS